MPTEPDYRELLQRAQQCTDEVKEFLVAVCNSPTGKSNEALLSAAALTVEQMRIVEGQIGHIWDMFQQGEGGTHAPSPLDPPPPAQPAKARREETKQEPIPQSWPE
jgi:hypothetical protein